MPCVAVFAALRMLFIDALQQREASYLELSPNDDFQKDPLAAFGISEARRHYRRGVAIGPFLGLMKYYRQTYLDVIHQHELDADRQRRYEAVMARFFDRIEIQP